MSNKHKDMARGLERIERDIVALEEAIRAIALEIQSAYASYLTTLGQAVRQQLILASYHLCTQGYPEKFISLSLNRRQQLQQGLRKIGQQGAEQLLAQIKSEEEELEEQESFVTSVALVDPHVMETSVAIPPIVATIANSEENQSNPQQLVEPSFSEISPTAMVPPREDFSPPVTMVPPPLFASKEQFLSEESVPETIQPAEKDVKNEQNDSSGDRRYASKIPHPKPLDTANPIEIAKWQRHLEMTTQQTLKTISSQANFLLQNAGILPKKLPEPILEAAVAVSEASAEMMPGPPNLLNLVIEIETGEQDSTPTRIVAINLRLGEIEFADSVLSSKRKQIRLILAQLNKLGLEYQKRQQERAIAQAEAAWRATWFDE